MEDRRAREGNVKLQSELLLPQAKLTGVGLKPGKDETTVVLALRAALTRDVAEAFGCRELIYAGDVPRSGVDRMALEGHELECEVHFRFEDNMAFSAVGCEVGKYVARMEGDGPKLQFQVKVGGVSELSAKLCDAVKVDPLEITIKPAQMDFGFSKQEDSSDGAEDAPAEGPDESTDFLKDLETTVR
jgi:hypothetical protein